MIDKNNMFIFIIIDGIVHCEYIKNMEEKYHMDLFNNLLFQSKINKKYKFYPYYYFPRGSILINKKTSNVISNLPLEFDSLTKSLTYSAYGLLNFKIEEIPGEHYSLDFVMSQIDKNNWSLEDKQMERDFAYKFYNNQINKYKKIIYKGDKMFTKENVKELILMVKKMSHQNKEKYEEMVKLYKNLYTHILRTYTGKLKPTLISKDARAKIGESLIKDHGSIHKINSDLKEHGAISIDHIYPLKGLVQDYMNDMIDLDELINKASEQAIILKEENKLLNKKHKIDRKEGYEKIFKELNIEIEKY